MIPLLRCILVIGGVVMVATGLWVLTTNPSFFYLGVSLIAFGAGAFASGVL